MKIKMHYLSGKKQQIACGRKNVIATTNFREITCNGCLRTAEHKKTIANVVYGQIGMTPDIK